MLLFQQAAMIVFILLSGISVVAHGKPVETGTNTQSTFLYWVWRQPPYIISIGPWGYPYVIPSAEIIIAWGGENDDILFTNTLDALDDSPYPDNLYKSPDNGISWEHIDFNFDDNEIRSLVVYPTTPTIILAGTSNAYPPGGMYRSSDGGITWQNVLPGRIIYDIEVDALNPSKLYAATCCWGGIYTSSDFGQTWDKISDRALEDIESHPSQPNLLFGARYLSTNPEEGICKSADGGEIWTQITIPDGKGQSHIIIDTDQPNRMFAFGASYYGIWRTDDGGQNWVDLLSNLPVIVAPPTVLSAAIDPQDNALWIGLKYGGMLVSDDNGETWMAENNGIPFVGASIFGPQCTSIAISSSDRFAITCSGRVYVRTDLEIVWLPLILR